jgi:hypothetical protein
MDNETSYDTWVGLDKDVVLVKPGWSALRQVSFKVSILCYQGSRVPKVERGTTISSVMNSVIRRHIVRSSSSPMAHR